MDALLTVALLALCACTKQPKASDDQLEAFDPPTVQLRGDVAPRQERRFARLDESQDDALSVDEFHRNGAQRIAAFDTDHDGKVSRSELVEGALARFDRLDADKNGQVTPQERSAAPDTTS